MELQVTKRVFGQFQRHSEYEFFARLEIGPDQFIHANLVVAGLGQQKAAELHQPQVLLPKIFAAKFFVEA